MRRQLVYTTGDRRGQPLDEEMNAVVDQSVIPLQIIYTCFDDTKS